MSWVGDIANLTKQTLRLNSRVEKNAEQISALHDQLAELTKFTKKVASHVAEHKRAIADCKKDIGNFQERSQSESEKLVLKLENELLKLESRLNGKVPHSVQVIEVGQKHRSEDGAIDQG